MNDDPESLSNILADLTNPEKEVREAAIEAAEQFGSTNAIPILKNLAANDGDPEEKAALLEAANFLSLPSIFDTGTSTTPAEREARRQAQMQKRAPNQNSPAAPNN
jgi:HEAT repeat protein